MAAPAVLRKVLAASTVVVLATTVAVAPRSAHAGIPGTSSRGGIGGCLVGKVSTVARSIDPQRRWYVGTKSSSWKSALYSAAGPKGPVAVVGDSLTFGSLNATMNRLIDAGFGPICIDGAVSRRVVVSGVVNSGVQVITRLKNGSSVWRAPDVRWVVALGTNDARSSSAYVATYSNTIQKGVAAIGSTTNPILWVDVRTFRSGSYTYFENQWNQRLTGSRITPVSWSAFVDGQANPQSLFARDKIHLTGSAYKLRGALVAAAVVTAATPPDTTSSSSSSTSSSPSSSAPEA